MAGRRVIHAAVVACLVDAAALKSRQQATLRHLFEDAPTEKSSAALMNLDRNGDGFVSQDEVAAFASKNGMETSALQQEFIGLDTNHDGTLDISEITLALGTDPQPSVKQAAMSVAKAEPVVPPASVAPAPAAAEPEPADDPLAAAALLSKELANEAQSRSDASVLERKALEVRAGLASYARQAVQQVLAEGEKAAAEKARDVVQRLSEVQRQTRDAEAQAALLRARSKAELQQATTYMALAEQALKDAGDEA